ncbi:MULTISPECIES: hypothetical protein [Streptomyces]|uniref:hypothetical protein n=1 Tax=Streptomyces TaxID=1883 RepID=UPI000C187268|nr:hypothetical protein [Streptomyces sp. RK75]MBQ0863167.1 hypothetical protein [Streptomyces sp. RK75]
MGCLTKPFDPWVLRTKVAVFLDLYRKNRQSSRLLEEEQRRLDDFADRLAAIESRLAADGTADTARLARDVAALADALDELRGSWPPRSRGRALSRSVQRPDPTGVTARGRPRTSPRSAR